MIFFSLLVLIDRNNAKIDVINLSTVDTGTIIGQTEYTEATGQIYPVRVFENVMNGLIYNNPAVIVKIGDFQIGLGCKVISTLNTFLTLPQHG